MQPTTKLRRITMLIIQFESNIQSALRHHATQAWNSSLSTASARIIFFSQISFVSGIGWPLACTAVKPNKGIEHEIKQSKLNLNNTPFLKSRR